MGSNNFAQFGKNSFGGNLISSGNMSAIEPQTNQCLSAKFASNQGIQLLNAGTNILKLHTSIPKAL